MRMREENRVDLIPLILEECWIWRNQINTRRIVAPECDADIDQDPPAIMLRAVPISVQVHTDLAAPAEWQKHELIRLGFGHMPRLVFRVAAIDLQQADLHQTLIKMIYGIARTFKE